MTLNGLLLEEVFPSELVNEILKVCAKLASMPSPHGKTLTLNAPGYRVEFHRLSPHCPHCGKELKPHG